MVKIYELTDKEYNKFLVRGIQNDAEGKRLAKRGFKKSAWIPGGVTHYADTSKKQGYKTRHGTSTMTKAQFLKYCKDIYLTDAQFKKRYLK